MIKVLVVDDSAVARAFLVHVISHAPGFTVIGTASDGVEAVEAASRLRPDIITMDITMPRMSGQEAIEKIMQTAPAPIVVVTGNTITGEVRATFESLESGALAIVPRPHSLGTAEGLADAEHLVRTLRLMSEIKVVRRIARRPRATAVHANPAGELSATPPFRVVAMGASTGGPSALKAVISGLRRDFPVPVLIVQHIAAGFVDGFASWLRDSAAMPVELAIHGAPLQPGRIYIGPDNVHFGVDGGERVSLTAPRETTRTVVCPSVTHLFESVARVYGAHAIGVLLTGMGRDGADGLLQLKQAGAVTIAQDKESSVVHGMPGEAINLGAADFVLPPPRIGELLATFAAAAYPTAK